MTGAPALEYRLVDADNHYYEPYDCFTRHVERRFADRAIRVVPSSDGLGRLYIGEDRLGYSSVAPCDYMGAPGAQRVFFEGVEDNQGWRQFNIIRPRDFPEMMTASARLELMDDQNIEACVMLPTLGTHWEPEMPDVESIFANLTAFNRWLEDDWGYARDQRIFSVPLMSLMDVERGVAELERVLALGARMIALRAGPVDGRSPADPHFDPFWARVDEAGVPVVLHTGNFGYSAWFGTQWSEMAHPRLHEMSAFQWATCQNERPVTDTLTALILHNLFGRFPNVRVLSIENGSAWVAPLLAVMDKAAKMAGRGPWLGGPIEGKPSELFREHVYVSPFFEDDIVGLVELIGVDRVLFGSDHPHPEGLEEPGLYAERIASLSPGDVRKIMRENTSKLIGLDSQ